jgi:hypothetical protein
MIRAPSNPVPKPSLQDFDIDSYSHAPSVDMSGYIPLSKRFDESEIKSKLGSAPFFIDIKLDGSIPRAIQRSRNWVSSKVRQQRRIFHRFETGIKLALSLGRRLRLLTLTVHKDYDISRLAKDLQVFRKRVEHATFERDGYDGFHMEYCCVSTSEGNGVLHLLYVASEVKHRLRKVTLDNLPHVHRRKGGFPVKRSTDLGYIPNSGSNMWLKSVWAEIIGNPVPNFQQVNIQSVYGGASRIANYLCQYVAGQSKVRHLSWSFGWVYRGFVRDWKKSFAPRLARLYSIGATFDELNAVFRDWDKCIFLNFVARAFPYFDFRTDSTLFAIK